MSRGLKGPPRPGPRRGCGDGALAGPRRQAAAGCLVALGLALHALEGLLPPLPWPGARLGLANLATLAALSRLGGAGAVGVAGLRAALGSLWSGGPLAPGAWMSLAGALASAGVMAGLSRLGWFSGRWRRLSLAGALTHNLAQLAVAWLLAGPGVLGLAGWLLALGALAGEAVGRAAEAALGRWERAAPLSGRPRRSARVLSPASPAATLRAKAARPRAVARVGVAAGGVARATALRAWVALGLVALALLGTAVVGRAGAPRAGGVARRGPWVVVEVAGRRVAQADLGGGRGGVLRVALASGEARLEVACGRARVLPLPVNLCPRGVCSGVGWLERPGETAVCLPNRMVVRIQQGPPAGVPHPPEARPRRSLAPRPAAPGPAAGTAAPAG